MNCPFSSIACLQAGLDRDAPPRTLQKMSQKSDGFAWNFCELYLIEKTQNAFGEFRAANVSSFARISCDTAVLDNHEARPLNSVIGTRIIRRHAVLSRPVRAPSRRIALLLAVAPICRLQNWKSLVLGIGKSLMAHMFTKQPDLSKYLIDFFFHEVPVRFWSAW